MEGVVVLKEEAGKGIGLGRGLDWRWRRLCCGGGDLIGESKIGVEGAGERARRGGANRERGCAAAG